MLAADLYAELKAQGAAPARYRLLEVSPELRERQRGPDRRSAFPTTSGGSSGSTACPERIDGLVVANEVLDVLPCSLVHRAGGEILERGVVLTEAGFAWEDMAASRRRAQAPRGTR